MCQNVFKNTEKKQRKEDFTRLFANLAVSVAQKTVQQPQNVMKK